MLDMKSIETIDLNTLEELTLQMQPIFGQPKNIHLYTVQLGKMALSFIEMDNKYNISNPDTFEETAAEILLYSDNNAMVKTVLQTIRSHQNTPDKEAGLKVQDLLTKAWSMAKQFNEQFLIIDSLQQNIINKGGCYPGISARLIQPYAMYIKNIMQERKNIEFGVIEQQAVISQEQKDIEMAIQNSLLDKKSTSTIDTEQHAIEIAMNNSLSTQSHASSDDACSSTDQHKAIHLKPNNPFAADLNKAKLFETLPASSPLSMWVNIASSDVIAVLTKMKYTAFKSLAKAKKPDGIFGVDLENGIHKPGLKDLPANGLEKFFKSKNMIEKTNTAAAKPLIFSKTNIHSDEKSEAILNNGHIKKKVFAL